MLQQLRSFMTHLIQTLPPCMHIHKVNPQAGGQLATMCVLKENKWESNPHLQHPLSVEQGFCRYTFSVFMFTLRSHLLGTAEHDSHLTIHSFPFISLSALSHTSELYTLCVQKNTSAATVCSNSSDLDVFYRSHPELQSSRTRASVRELRFSHVNLINKMATHQAAPFMLHHGGCGEGDVRLQKALILGLNASCLAETHKSSPLSQNHSLRSI